MCDARATIHRRPDAPSLHERIDHQLGRCCDVVVSQQPVKAAERIAQIAAYIVGNGGEKSLGLGGVRLGCGASLHDRFSMRTKALGGAHRRTKVLGADAPIHTRGVVGTGYRVVESVEHCCFQFGRQFRPLPYRANFALGTPSVALAHQHTRERKSASRASRFLANEAAHRGGVAPLLP